MFGKGLYQEEEAQLREIIRSIDKKIDYTAREGDGSRFNLHLVVRGLQADVSLDLEDLTSARSNMVTRHQIRQKIKSRYGSDILGLKPARLLHAAPKPESTSQHRGFSRGPRR